VSTPTAGARRCAGRVAGHGSVCNAATHERGEHECTVIHRGCQLALKPTAYGKPSVMHVRALATLAGEVPSRCEGSPVAGRM